MIHIWARTPLLNSVLPANVVMATGVGHPVGGGGARFDTVTVTGAEVAVLPAASPARAVSVCAPLLAAVVFQATSYGAVLSVPSGCPSTKNSTAVTPTLSVALALTMTVPDTSAPLAGSVIATLGGVVSDAVLDTVTVTGAEVVRLPAASRATAVRVWEPLLAVAVFQGTE